MAENLQLRKQLEEMEKENIFFKKAAALFAKEIDTTFVKYDSKHGILNKNAAIEYFKDHTEMPTFD